jgi:outer membrane protein assembly factor BamD
MGLTLMLVGIGISGCSTTDETPYVERPVEELYNEGRVQLAEGRYEKAAAAFDEIERQHPYSEWAAQGQLMASYAYYLAQKYEKALTGLESFITLHPSHIDVAYAYYLRGLCYYEQIAAIQRDQKVTQMALDAFLELIKKHPHTKYARDARVKVELLRDRLAAREMEVGRYYQRIKAYPAAINRFKEVILNYQTTAHVEEALHRLVEIYLALGLNTEARKAAAILGHNFPGSAWYMDTYRLVENVDFQQAEDKQEALSWLESLDLGKHKNKVKETDQPEVYMPPELEKETSHSDLTRPVERLGTPEGYEKAKKKITEERSVFETVEDWMTSKPKAQVTPESKDSSTSSRSALPAESYRPAESYGRK